MSGKAFSETTTPEHPVSLIIEEDHDPLIVPVTEKLGTL